jgi:hypothetical protein
MATSSATILLIGDDDGHAFLRKGFIDKVEQSGTVGEVVGDGAFCEILHWRGERGLTSSRLVVADEASLYARNIRSAAMCDPAYIALLSPPDDVEVYERLKVALHGLSISLIVVALPSATIEEFLEKADRLVDGLRMPFVRVATIYGGSVTERYLATHEHFDNVEECHA